MKRYVRFRDRDKMRRRLNTAFRDDQFIWLMRESFFPLFLERASEQVGSVEAGLIIARAIHEFAAVAMPLGHAYELVERIVRQDLSKIVGSVVTDRD